MERLWVDAALMGATVVGALVAGIGALLTFILRGIRETQKDIWAWAREETRVIEEKIDKRGALADAEMRDIRRWVRHEFRSMYSELIAITQVLGKHGADIEESIHKRLEQMADE